MCNNNVRTRPEYIALQPPPPPPPPPPSPPLPLRLILRLGLRLLMLGLYVTADLLPAYLQSVVGSGFSIRILKVGRRGYENETCDCSLYCRQAEASLVFGRKPAIHFPSTAKRFAACRPVRQIPKTKPGYPSSR